MVKRCKFIMLITFFLRLHSWKGKTYPNYKHNSTRCTKEGYPQDFFFWSLVFIQYLFHCFHFSIWFWFASFGAKSSLVWFVCIFIFCLHCWCESSLFWWFSNILTSSDVFSFWVYGDYRAALQHGSDWIVPIAWLQLLIKSKCCQF